MLTHRFQTSAKAAKAYYGVSDYYVPGQAQRITMHGQTAKRLGLQGEVTKEQFDALCDAIDPITGASLQQRKNDQRTVLLDLTFSAPKPVSILQGLTQDDRILDAFNDAFNDAVTQTMHEVEQWAMTRVRKKGADHDRHTGNLAWAQKTEFTGRPCEKDGRPDMQLHAHNTIFNFTFDGEEARPKAVQFREIMRHLPYFEAAFHARLSASMRQLGYTITHEGDRDWGIEGISRDLVKKFSRRQRAISDSLSDVDRMNPKARQIAALETRRVKEEDLSEPQLRSYWKSRLDADDKRGLAHTISGAKAKPSQTLPKLRESIDFALAHHFEREAAPQQHRVLATALRHGLGRITPEAARAEMATRSLITADLDGVRRITSRGILAEEREIAAFASRGLGAVRPLNAGGSISRDYLSPSQRSAVERIWNSPDRLMMVLGPAGSGKTEMAKEAIEGIEAAGRSVLAVAPSASASRGTLRESGFKDADTVAALLAKEELQQKVRGGVIWLDEAGLLGHADALRLTRLAKQLDARIVAVGDPSQHASVGRGALIDVWRQAGVIPSYIKGIRRQKPMAYREAAEALSRGNVSQAIGKLNDLGWIHTASADQRPALVAADYVRSTEPVKTRRGEREPDVLVVTPTNSEAALINTAIRDALKKAHRLHEEREFARLRPLHLTEAERASPSSYQPGDVLQYHRHGRGDRRAGARVCVNANPSAVLTSEASKFAAYRPEPIRLAIGDRIRLTANGKSLDGHRLNNGATYRIKGFDRQDNVVLNNGWTLDKNWGHWNHAYVSTSWSSQSKTVDKVILSQGLTSAGASSKEQLYVSLTRARNEAAIYTEDAQTLLDLTARSEKQNTAGEVNRQRKRQWKQRLKDALQRRRDQLANVIALQPRSPVQEPEVSHARKRIRHVDRLEAEAKTGPRQRGPRL